MGSIGPLPHPGPASGLQAAVGIVGWSRFNLEPWLSGCRVLSGCCRGLSGGCRAVECRAVSGCVGSRRAGTRHAHLSGAVGCCRVLSGVVGCCRGVGLSGCRVAIYINGDADPNTLSRLHPTTTRLATSFSTILASFRSPGLDAPSTHPRRTLDAPLTPPSTPRRWLHDPETSRCLETSTPRHLDTPSTPPSTPRHHQ